MLLNILTLTPATQRYIGSGQNREVELRRQTPILFCFVVVSRSFSHMNDLDDFGFGNIGPDTIETENQQEQEPKQESQKPFINYLQQTMVALALTHQKQRINKNKNQNKNCSILFIKYPQ